MIWRVQLRRVDGKSMSPAVRSGSLLVVWSRPRRLRCGDLILFRHDGLEHVKRLHKVKADQVYVLGDNPELSTDSRDIGWLPRSAVTGRVVWPRQA